MQRLNKLCACTALTGVTLMSGGTAYAEAASADATSTSVKEVVVTAERRAERLEDVPASITALSADALVQSGIVDSADLAKLAPSVTMPYYGSFLQPSIRGISSTGAGLGDNSNVALYIDGVYQPQQIASTIDLADVQQVEILKGPQGALYGQNATGGAILVNTLAPSFHTTGFLSASYGNYNDVSVRGYVTGPLSDKIAVLLSGGYENHGGYRTNIVTGQHDSGLDSKVVRGKVLFEPEKQVKLTLTGFYTDRRDSAPYSGEALNNNSTGYAYYPNAPRTTDPMQYETTPGTYVHTKSYGTNLKAEVDVGPGTLNSITAYTYDFTDYLADVDFSPVNLGVALTPDLDSRYVIEDANFTSKKFGPVSFLVGGFFLSGREVFNTSDFEGNFTSPTLEPAAPVFNYHDPQVGRVEKLIWAVYGEITYQVTDHLVLTADGRYTQERQRAFANLTAPLYLPYVTEYPFGPQTFSKFTPRITARYEFLPNQNVYVSWGEGFKSGLINDANFGQPPVQPETIDAWEVGYKGRPLENVTFNIAGFYYDYKNLQVVAYNPPQYIDQNAASARLYGVDGDLTWRVVPQFTLSIGASYLNAHYVSFPNAAVFVPNGFGDTEVVEDLSGKPLQRAPTFTGTFSGDYHIDTDVGQFGAFVSVYTNSGFGFEISNRVRQGPYTTVDADLSFSPIHLPGLRFVAWGRNLSDTNVIASFLDSQFADGVSYAAPRTFGGRIEYRF